MPPSMSTTYCDTRVWLTASCLVAPSRSRVGFDAHAFEVAARLNRVGSGTNASITKAPPDVNRAATLWKQRPAPPATAARRTC